MLLTEALGLPRPKNPPQAAAPAGPGKAATHAAKAKAKPAKEAAAAKPAVAPEVQARLDALARRFEALAPRLAAAGEAHQPKFIADREVKIEALQAVVSVRLERHDLQGSEVAFSQLGAALDTLEAAKRAFAEHLRRRQAAKDGAVKTALRVELVPAALADSRTRALERREKEIEKLADAGKLADADDRIKDWEKEAQAWLKSKDAFETLRSKKPKAGELEDLVDIPGGGAVLDALVADLPDDAPQDALMAAMKARYDVKLEQFDHRKGKGANPNDKTHELDPKTPDKALKGLYKVLGKVPVKDVKEIEKIERYVDETGGAEYQGGIIKDTVRLYCGRPDDGRKEKLGKEGEVVPVGEQVQPGCEAIKTDDPPPAFDFATLHEVGHAVDDANNIMKGGRSADAGWAEHSVGDVAEKIAGAVHFDVGYIKATLKAADNKPPAEAPQPPKGVEAKAWEKARQAAVAWCADIRTSANPWNDAGVSKQRSIGGIVYHESYEGQWVSYKYAARAQGISGYQFRSSYEWFAELYAAYHCERLNPSHPAAQWLGELKAKSET